MTSLLVRLFIRNRDDVSSPNVRRAYGTMVSIVGILANVLLSVLKLIAGALTGAISVTADALNNLSDAGSQVVSLVSFKISAKPADRHHPFGHARMEYVASMIVSFLVLTVGVELLKQSVGKLIAPAPTVFSTVSTVILAVSIVVKVWLFLFNRRIAKHLDSSVMRATAADSLSDAAATAAVLVSMLIARFTGFETDAYMGIIVSVVILIAGLKILNETKNSILGGQADPAVVEGICQLCGEYPEVLGIHDMIVHNYGPGNTIASLHVEVDGAADVFVTHDVIDTIEKRLYDELFVHATIHMDPIVTDDERVTALRETTLAVVRSIDERLNIHDFRFVEGKTHSNLIFDVSVPFELKMSDDALKREIASRISRFEPTYFVVVTVDRQ